MAYTYIGNGWYIGVAADTDPTGTIASGSRLLDWDTGLTYVWNGSVWLQITIPDGSTSLKGKVELATDGETGAGVVVQGNDSRLNDARTPTAHAASHLSDGSDAIAQASTTVRGTVELAADGESAANLVPQANDARLSNARAPTSHASSHVSGGGDAIKLDDLAAPDDNTDLNASTSAHGLLKKLSNTSTEYLNGAGNFATPALADISGTLAIGKGGTGQTTQTAAYDALSPNTTLGDISYHNGSDNVRLAGNTTVVKQWLSQIGNGSVSAAPAWSVPRSIINFTYGSSPSTNGFWSVRYAYALGGGSINATESNVSTVYPYGFTVKKMFFRMGSNALNSTITVSFRDDGADVTGAVLTTSGAGSIAEVASADLNVAVAAGSAINFKLDPSASSSGAWAVGYIYVIAEIDTV